MASSQVRAQELANKANLEIADKNNQTQIDLMREQNQWNLEQWQRENEYNSPEQQRQRLMDAGLNPNLLLGSSNTTGVASAPAQGVAPPQLQQAHMEPEYESPEIKANAFQQIAGAFKNFGEFSKSMSDTGVNVQQLSFVHDMAVKGFNPELIKARTSLEMFNQLITSGKYQVPQIEAIIRDYNQRSNYNAWAAEERREMADKIRAEYEGIKFTNKFNKDKAPLELAKLAVEVRDIFLGTNTKMSVAESQINLANAESANQAAQTALANKQSELVGEQTEAQKYDNAIKRLKAGLADMGINPDDKHLPFFAGLGLALHDNTISAVQVSNLFDMIGFAENIGYSNLAKSNADLSKFQLFGEKTGPFGIPLNMTPGSPQNLSDLKSFFVNLLSGKK